MGFEGSFNDATGLIIFSSVAALTFAAVSSGGDNNNNILSALDNSSLDNLYLINQIEHFAIVFLGEAIVALNLRRSPFFFNHTIYWTYKLS